LFSGAVAEIAIPPLPGGRVLLDRRVGRSVDTLFQMMHTNSQFFRTWLVRAALIYYVCL
jgi:hypothetical protein